MRSQPPVTTSHDYLICRSPDSEQYQIYRFNPAADLLFESVATSTSQAFPKEWNIAQIGGYLLQWGPLDAQIGDGVYPFKLLAFNPESDDPLNATPIQTGQWPKNKFWDYRQYYSNNPNEAEQVSLIPMGSFVLNTILTEGRGTFRLFNFDPFIQTPGTQDPLTSYFGLGQGSFPLIKQGHQLISVGNYVIDRHPDGQGYKLWSFDPQLQVPLSLPTVQEGQLSQFTRDHQLVAIGELLLDWQPESGHFRLWGFDPEQPGLLVGPLREGALPSEIASNSQLTPFQARRQIDSQQTHTPGTLDFMRDKIKHVVYYMVESRSFDNVLGWLYEQGDSQCHFIGSDEPFEGASSSNYNEYQGKKYYQSKFKDGQLSKQWNLMPLNQDPFHNTVDGLQQMFTDINGYWQKQQPDMGGYVLNNANPQVMETLTPTQLPVLNGLAENFAVSDQWFCSMPGGTDVNRGFSVTGSAYNKLGTWEGGDAYQYFPNSPHRQSIWKVLASQGIQDWKIYYSMKWKEQIFTYQLYLEGQVPSVDKNPDQFMVLMDEFKKDAQQGTLPAFSYLEPFWYKPDGTTSYHPGCDLVPAEVALNEIYNTIKEGPGWEHTLLVITFDKNNGIYDHVKPPYAAKPWPNDLNNGFAYDLMGPRVPCVMVSPWIKANTVFRSTEPTPYDSTSFAATLLHWFGIPKAQWALGDRLANAPTFESVFQQNSARSDLPEFTPPFDHSFPKK